MSNYFNQLNFRKKLKQLHCCRLIKNNEFNHGIHFLKNKNIVIIGCGSQGLNQGLNMRDSGLNISFVFRNKSIKNLSTSFQNAVKKNFKVGNFKQLIPQADLIINLTPDKKHKSVIERIEPLIKQHAILGYSHGFNIIEMFQKIRKDITVIMVAPKCPGTEVRKEYKKNFGVPSLIAVHKENDPKKNGLNIAKSWAYALGSHKSGVLESSFTAEVKSDLIGEQTILCGMLQTGSIVCFDYMLNNNIDSQYAAQLIQFGWKKITKSLKIGGIQFMMDKVSNSAKIRIYELSNHIKKIMKKLFKKHIDNILSGSFSFKMINDWNHQDKFLLKNRKKIQNCKFENMHFKKKNVDEQIYFDHCTAMIAIIKAGVELSFELMIESGIKKESAYYESLHELPFIANLIAKKKLYMMNFTISDTAEYGSYLFSKNAIPILKKNFSIILHKNDLGRKIPNIKINNKYLLYINNKIAFHPIEIIGNKLRTLMYRKLYL